LNDPGKRKNYDLYGIKGDELEGINFDDFADEFKLFEEFIDEFLGVLRLIFIV
jgi:DnaJ-class molecular chaperone